MKPLEKILRLLQEPEWVTRPETDVGFEEDLEPDQARAMKEQVAPPKPPSRTAPLSPEQLDINLSGEAPRRGDIAPEPEEAPMSNARRRLQHAATMDEMARRREPRSRPMKSLAGGGYGSGIF